MIWRVKLVVV